MDKNHSLLTNKNGKGAILFSVMGGRLSEGINFKDYLARVVVCMGLPYPNIKSPEIVERMKYYDKISNENLLAKKGGDMEKFDGNQFYLNLCMRVVNQSIGRAIRHKDDYAMI